MDNNEECKCNNYVPFEGRYKCINCNGMPRTRQAELTPPETFEERTARKLDTSVLEGLKTLDRTGIIKGYMKELAMKSVEAQKKRGKYDKQKFREMGLKSAIVRRANREANKRKKLDEAGEAVDFQLK